MEASSDTQCHTECDCYLLGSVTPLHFHRLPFATQAPLRMLQSLPKLLEDPR